jgi:excisionase family DNA binding protein
MAEDSRDVLFTVEEAATFLRVNRKTVYEAVRSNQLPGVVRLGKAIRIGRAALREWIRGRSVPPR